jgi:hypothetical protein
MGWSYWLEIDRTSVPLRAPVNLMCPQRPRLRLAKNYSPYVANSPSIFVSTVLLQLLLSESFLTSKLSPGTEFWCPKKPHFVVIPWPGTSHIIPIVDVACLLAAHGAPVTVITTPASAQLVQGRVERARKGSPAGITVAAIPFPGAEAGLPDGCERLDHVPSADLVPRFFDAGKLFGQAVARHCRLMANAVGIARRRNHNGEESFWCADP